MVYEWDADRAHRARKVKLASQMELTIAALVIPAGVILAAISSGG